jgi:hypothetical protein
VDLVRLATRDLGLQQDCIPGSKIANLIVEVNKENISKLTAGVAHPAESHLGRLMAVDADYRD